MHTADPLYNVSPQSCPAHIDIMKTTHTDNSQVHAQRQQERRYLTKPEHTLKLQRAERARADDILCEARVREQKRKSQSEKKLCAIRPRFPGNVAFCSNQKGLTARYKNNNVKALQYYTDACLNIHPRKAIIHNKLPFLYQYLHEHRPTIRYWHIKVPPYADIFMRAR